MRKKTKTDILRKHRLIGCYSEDDDRPYKTRLKERLRAKYRLGSSKDRDQASNDKEIQQQ